MTTIKFKRAAFILGLAAITTVGNGLSVQAQTAQTNVEPTDAIQTLSITTPIPGTALTAADALTAQPQTSQMLQIPEINAQNSVNTVAQSTSSVTTSNRGGSYIGAGFDIGLTGDTALGDSGFVIVSKLGFTENLSLRGIGVIGDGTVLMFNVAYDFPILLEPFEPLKLAPFVGGGVAFDLDEERVGPVISGGVDYPINDNFTATASLNIGFIREDTTDVGILFGVGYNFSGLIRR